MKQSFWGNIGPVYARFNWWRPYYVNRQGKVWFSLSQALPQIGIQIGAENDGPYYGLVVYLLYARLEITVCTL